MAFTTFSSAELFHKYDVKYLTLILLITKPVRVQHGETIIEAGQLGVEMFLIHPARSVLLTNSFVPRNEISFKVICLVSCVH